MDNNKYDKTISDSKAESLLKAISILETETKITLDKPIRRPDINVAKTTIKHLFIFCMYLLISILFFGLSNYFNVEPLYMHISLVALGLIFIIFTFKKFCVDLILVYQKLAPEKIRRSCLFEPSCSEYMLLAIDKYGALKGVFKGIKRLLRCHHPNGGVDYP